MDRADNDVTLTDEGRPKTKTSAPGAGISDTIAASLRVISMISVRTVCLINRKRELIKLYIQRSAHLFDSLKDHASSDVTSKLITLGGRCW